MGWIRPGSGQQSMGALTAPWAFPGPRSSPPPPAPGWPALTSLSEVASALPQRDSGCSDGRGPGSLPDLPSFICPVPPRSALHALDIFTSHCAQWALRWIGFLTCPCLSKRHFSVSPLFQSWFPSLLLMEALLKCSSPRGLPGHPIPCLIPILGVLKLSFLPEA